MILCVLVYCVLSAAYGVINDDKSSINRHYAFLYNILMKNSESLI